MKAIALLVLLVAAVCLVEGRAAEESTQKLVPKAPVVLDLAKVENAGALTKERLEQFRQAVEAFKNKIDATRMNTAHKEGLKAEAMARLAERIAELKQRVPKKA
uniref:Uncharacterized protein n=1 Tax=Anopheles culicifacies TaxID=139723 RepID=A0A182MAZ3_9DIPT